MPPRVGFHFRSQTFRPDRTMKMVPATQAAAPPTIIQTALSVGEPVKNLETSELKELVALMPNISSKIPPANRARAIGLFI